MGGRFVRLTEAGEDGTEDPQAREIIGRQFHGLACRRQRFLGAAGLVQQDGKVKVCGDVPGRPFDRFAAAGDPSVELPLTAQELAQVRQPGRIAEHGQCPLHERGPLGRSPRLVQQNTKLVHRMGLSRVALQDMSIDGLRFRELPRGVVLDRHFDLVCDAHAAGPLPRSWVRTTTVRCYSSLTTP